MDLFQDYLVDALTNFRHENMITKFFGDRSILRPSLVKLMEEVEYETRNNPGMHLNFAINYGGRDEIVKACRKLAVMAKNREIDPGKITEKDIASYLYTAGQPDPDILIRPGGEKRISNFLTWQSAYSELMFFDVLWPDFAPKHIEQAIDLYNERERRYGGV